MRARRACPSARLPATLRPARGRARTTPDAWRARPPCRRHARRDGRRRRRTLSTPATLRPPRAGGVAPRRSRSGAPRACSGRGTRSRPPPSARGSRPGAPRARPERARRAPPSSGGAGSRSPRPPARGRSATREGRARGRARRACARPRRGARSGGGAGPRDTAHARRSPGRRAASSVARAASSAFAGQPRSREASAISASATTHRARATASFGPKARAARRRRAFARTRSPSCAIAMPRSASAGASSRRATRFNAPRGSPAASARAAAVISESIGIPSHLSLPPFDRPALSSLMTNAVIDKKRDDERTENRRSGRPGDGRQPRHRASPDGSAPDPGREEGLRDGAQSGGAARPA